MAGQIPTVVDDNYCDEMVRVSWAGDPTEQQVYLGVALRDMWLEAAVVRYETPDDGIADLTGHLAKVAVGSGKATNTDMTTANELKFKQSGTENTAQFATVLSTANEVKKGEAIILELSRAPNTAGTPVAGVTVEALFTTRRK